MRTTTDMTANPDTTPAQARGTRPAHGPRETLAALGGSAVRTEPWPAWPQATDSTREAVLDVLSSTRWALSGPYGGRACYERRFAEAFAAFHDVPFCTPASSGTASLTIALQALGVGRGDEVLVPGLTWVACASVVSNLGAVPVLVDVDPVSLTMDPRLAAAACTSRTTAILVVHAFCSLADLDALTELARQRGLAMVEDCSQAHGARWNQARVGTFGAVGCFSMQQSKLLTSGEGGAAITADAVLADRMEQLRSDGRRFAATPQPGRLELVEVGDVQGRNLCLSEFQAAILLDGLSRLDEQNARRAENVACLESELAAVDGVSLLPRDPRVTTPAYYNLVLRFDPDAFAGHPVDVIADALSAELGTPVNPVYQPLNEHRLLCPTRIPRGDLRPEELDRLDMTRYALPQARHARRTCATLTHPVLLDDTWGMASIAEAVAKVQRRRDDLHRLAPRESTQAF